MPLGASSFSGRCHRLHSLRAGRPVRGLSAQQSCSALPTRQRHSAQLLCSGFLPPPADLLSFLAIPRPLLLSIFLVWPLVQVEESPGRQSLLPPRPVGNPFPCARNQTPSAPRLIRTAHRPLTSRRDVKGRSVAHGHELRGGTRPAVIDRGLNGWSVSR
jgi:hypothetical protein